MTRANLSGTWRRALLGAALAAASVALAGCNGGGVTSAAAAVPTATSGAYVLYASNYVPYASQTNGAYLHSIQAGDVYTGFGGKFKYGCYSSPPADMDRTQFYTLQAQANGDGNCTAGFPSGSPPNTDADYIYVAIKAPASNTTAATPPLVLSADTGTLLIQMGNTVVPDATHGHANVFTINLVSDVVGDGSTLTDKCSVDQTLTAVGRDQPESALGVINYAIPLASFSCSVGTLDTLKSNGVTTIAVTVTGDKNPDVVVGEFDTIAVGYVGFTR